MPKKGYRQTEEHKEKVRQKAFGRKHSETTKSKMSDSQKKSYTSDPERAKQHSDRMNKEGNPMYGIRRFFSEIWKQKMSKSHMGKRLSPTHRKNISKGKQQFYLENPNFNKLENHPNWQGGISFEPYEVAFNDKLKFEIRQRDDFTCQFCGILENGRAHDVHHINYDKKDSRERNLILLCTSCNAKVNYSREKWQFLFETLQEIKLFKVFESSREYSNV